MAVRAQDLTTLATVKLELGIATGVTTYDTVLERFIAVATDAIEKHCRRSFYQLSVSAEPVKGHGGVRLIVARTPIVSVSAITINGATVDSSSYSIEDAEARLLYKESGWQWTAVLQGELAAPIQRAGTEQSLYLVTYVGGYLTPTQGSRTLPYDVEQASIDTVVSLYRNRGRYQRLVEETTEEAEQTWPGKIIPGPALGLLKPYRRVA